MNKITFYKRIYKRHRLKKIFPTVRLCQSKYQWLFFVGSNHNQRKPGRLVFPMRSFYQRRDSLCFVEDIISKKGLLPLLTTIRTVPMDRGIRNTYENVPGCDGEGQTCDSSSITHSQQLASPPPPSAHLRLILREQKIFPATRESCRVNIGTGS